MGKGMLFSASSLSQAVLEAASHFGIAPEELAYERVDRRHGGLRAGRRVVVQVDPEAPRRPPGTTCGETSRSPAAAEGPALPAAAPARSSVVAETVAEPPAPTVRPEGADALAYEAVQDLLELGQVRLDARVSWGDDGLDVELFGPDEELAARRHGELLRSLEQLLPRMLRGAGSAPPCRVDCQGYRERREEELRQMALAAAERLRQEGAPQLLPALNPGERRVVHLTLQDVPDVQTESEGSGFLKRVRVEPAET